MKPVFRASFLNFVGNSNMADNTTDMLRFQELEQKRKMMEEEAAEFSSILESVSFPSFDISFACYLVK